MPLSRAEAANTVWRECAALRKVTPAEVEPFVAGYEKKRDDSARTLRAALRIAEEQ
jgi:hypothetical protein